MPVNHSVRRGEQSLKSFRSESVALVVGAFAFIAPIVLSLQLAWNQSVASEKADCQRYAAEVVRRGDQTAQQFGLAIRLLQQGHKTPCSIEDINLMRAIDVGSSYIQMVGRISGNALECTSLGTMNPVSVGQPTLTTQNGVREWMDFKFGPVRLENPDSLDLLESQGVAVVVDTRLLVDQAQAEDVNLALMVPSSAQRLMLVKPSGDFHPNWLNPLPRGESRSFTDGEFVVSQVRSRSYDFQAIAVRPLHHGYLRVRRFALIFVPIGLICGVALGWAVLQIARIRSSFPGLIRTAARNQDFYVEYQPVVELPTRRIVGAEALVRWRRGDTVINPASFIQLAEDSGVISLITDCVLETVARDFPGLLRLNPEFCIAVNLSATDLKDTKTPGKLAEMLRKAGATPRNLVVEATEHGLITERDSSSVIEAIRTSGIPVAIDDFGTGYSSLSYLQKLSIDFLKIDKAFVDTIGTDGPTSQVVLHIIDIAHSLRLQTVAEGVETEAQADFLLRRNVDLAQGWLFGKPMSIDKLVAELRTSEIPCQLTTES